MVLIFLHVDTTTAAAALAKGLQDLEDLCDVVSEEFWTEREKFEATPEQARKRQEEAEQRSLEIEA